MVTDSSSFCLPALPCLACCFNLGHKMAPASPGLKSSFQAGKRRKGKRQTALSSCALPFCSRKQSLPQGLLPIAHWPDLSHIVICNCKEGWSSTLLFSHAYIKESKEKRLEWGGDGTQYLSQ